MTINVKTLVGEVRTFRKSRAAFEVVATATPVTVRIRLLSTGEEADMLAEEVMEHPLLGAEPEAPTAPRPKNKSKNAPLLLS